MLSLSLVSKRWRDLILAHLLFRDIHLVEMNGEHRWDTLLGQMEKKASLRQQVCCLRFSCTQLKKDEQQAILRFLVLFPNVTRLEISALLAGPLDQDSIILTGLRDALQGRGRSLREVLLALDVDAGGSALLFDALPSAASLTTLGLKLRSTGPLCDPPSSRIGQAVFTNLCSVTIDVSQNSEASILSLMLRRCSLPSLVTLFSVVVPPTSSEFRATSQDLFPNALCFSLFQHL